MKTQRVLLLVLALMLALFSFSTGPAAAEINGLQAMVRIELTSAPDLSRLDAIQLTTLTQLYTKNGDSFLLALADSAQQAALNQAGFKLRVLDADSRGARYYLLAGRADALQIAGQSVTFLDQEGRQAIARLSQQQADFISEAGVELRLLQPTRLVFAGQSEKQPVAPLVVPDPVVQNMLAMVTASQVYSYTASLSGENPVNVGGQPYSMQTRYSKAVEPINKATQYVYERLTNLGLSTSYHNYNLWGLQGRNVIAEQPGTTSPENIYLITAHLDDTSQQPYVDAPGADDNGSGSVAVLMAADILSQYPVGCTVRYALFTGEEQGLIGSYAYANSVQNQNILGVLNLDMIAWNTIGTSNTFELHTRPANAADTAIANLYIQTVSAYGLPLTPLLYADGPQYSDHASFWDFNIPAIVAIEDDNDFNPYYHTTGDNITHIDINYYTHLVKASLGTFAHMGCFQSGGLSGVVADASSSQPISGASVVAQYLEKGEWMATTAGDGSYELDLGAAVYAVTASAPGYASQTVTGVSIPAGGTAVQDFALEPCSDLQDTDFTFSPSTPLVDDPITFSATANSSDTISFTWDFGDGGSAAGQEVTHSYSQPGDYQVTVTASTGCGLTQSASHTVPVVLDAILEFQPASVEVSLPIGASEVFTLTLSNLGGVTLDWTLAEAPEVDRLTELLSAGTILPGGSEAVDLTLTAPLLDGTYTTTLQIASNDATRPLVEIPVTLGVPCVAAGAPSFELPEEPIGFGEATFSAAPVAGTGSILYTWDFGDGSEPVNGIDLIEVSHHFPASPQIMIYPVTLTVSNGCGDPQTFSLEVQVNLSIFAPLAINSGS